MKKTKFMRAALLLLVLTLITSCFVGGTFAKYTTSSSGSDSARVAYWGFDQAAEIELNLFETTYKSANGETVKSKNSDNVMAPGTGGRSGVIALHFSTGEPTKDPAFTAPEVAYTVKVDLTNEGGYAYAINKLDANQNFTWKLITTTGEDESGKPISSEETYQTFEELCTAVKALSGAEDGSGTKRYEAGQLPEAFVGKDYAIGWEWKFESDDSDAKIYENGTMTQDEFDTKIGNTAYQGMIKPTITITATQID